MTPAEIRALAKGFAPVIAEYVSQSTAPLQPQSGFEAFASEVGKITGQTDHQVANLKKEVAALKRRLSRLEKEQSK